MLSYTQLNENPTYTVGFMGKRRDDMKHRIFITKEYTFYGRMCCC